MRMKCIVKGCENHKDEGGFEDGMCLPCYLFITTGEGVYSQAYRNAQQLKTWESEIEYLQEKNRQQQAEIEALKADNEQMCKALLKATRAILRKAQE